MALGFLAFLFGRVRQLGGDEPDDVLLDDGQRHRTDGDLGLAAMPTEKWVERFDVVRATSEDKDWN